MIEKLRTVAVTDHDPIAAAVRSLQADAEARRFARERIRWRCIDAGRRPWNSRFSPWAYTWRQLRAIAAEERRRRDDPHWFAREWGMAIDEACDMTPEKWREIEPRIRATRYAAN